MPEERRQKVCICMIEPVDKEFKKWIEFVLMNSYPTPTQLEMIEVSFRAGWREALKWDAEKQNVEQRKTK